MKAYPPPADLADLQRKAWILGAAGAAASIAGYFLDSTQFLRSYLVAWLLCVSVALGSMAIMMLNHIARGAWGMMARRIFEAATRTLPVVGLLFVPILLGMSELYIWARPEVMAADELLQAKAIYLNPRAFTLRAIFYFAVWSFFALRMSKLSLRQDETGDPKLHQSMRRLAPPALGIYVLLLTFASVDWIMSLDPHWYSSLFGIYILGGQGVAALAFMIPVALYLSRREPMSAVFKPLHFHDYGKLLLAFVMLWSYFAVSQLLIIRMGHLPEEIGWYIARSEGGWIWVSIALALFHFALPFLLLLSRDLKRNARTLSGVAIGLMFMRWVDLYWLVTPAFDHGHGGLHFHWLDLTTVLGLGGIWFALFVGQLRKRSLLPVNDPNLQEALSK